MRKFCLAVCLTLAALSGCATRWVVFGHPVGAAAAAPAGASATATSPKIKTVKVTLTPSAQGQLAAHPQFTTAGLSKAIEAELQTRHLLAPADGPEAGDTLAIEIDELAVRATSNAVLFGYVLSSGTLAGNLEVLTAAGQERKRAPIRVRAQLLEPAEGAGSASLEPLYQGFAGKAVRNLTGAAEPVAVNH